MQRQTAQHAKDLSPLASGQAVRVEVKIRVGLIIGYVLGLTDYRVRVRVWGCRTSPVWSLSTAAATYSGPPSGAVQMRTVLSAPAVTSWLWSARNFTSATYVTTAGQQYRIETGNIASTTRRLQLQGIGGHMSSSVWKHVRV